MCLKGGRDCSILTFDGQSDNIESLNGSHPCLLTSVQWILIGGGGGGAVALEATERQAAQRKVNHQHCKC